jgi:hypothetical protein
MNEFPMKYLRQDRVYGLEGILACEEGGGYCHYYCHASAIRVAFLQGETAFITAGAGISRIPGFLLGN